MGRRGTYVLNVKTPYDDPRQLGLAAKRARLNAGWTQDRLAEEAGTSRKRIGNIERGAISTLGETPEEWFASVAPIAAATGDLSLVGLEGPADQSEMVTLEQDVAALRDQVRELAEIVGEVPSANTSALNRLRGRLSATDQPPLEVPGEGQDR